MYSALFEYAHKCNLQWKTWMALCMPLWHDYDMKIAETKAEKFVINVCNDNDFKAHWC